MKAVFTGARVLLGLLFLIMGLNGFLLFMPPPPMTAFPHNAMIFNEALFASHYVYMTSGVQAVAGLLLVINRYVPFAIIVLAGVLVNIVTFHITMWPQALVPMPIIAIVLWFLAAWPLRKQFAPLFAARVAV